MKSLLPSTYQGSIYPISINFVDQEKVIALVKERTHEFCTVLAANQQFSVRVKIFPFTNRVNSLHILLLRTEAIGKQGDQQEEEEAAMYEETKTAERGGGAKDGAGKKRGASSQVDNPQGGNFDPNQNIPLKKKK